MSFYKEVPGRKTTLESTLKFDTTPTAGSTNPVTSEGVKSAIDGAVGDASEALQQQIDEITEKAGSGYTPKGEATVATLNGLTGQENGWLYTMTDAGTLTDGTLAVVAGDTVAWDATNEVWYKAMDYAPRQYGTNEVRNLPTTITAFRTGDVIPVDGPDGTAKMRKDDLLRVAAKNAIDKNLAAPFDAARTIDNPYKVGEYCTYNGRLYRFVTEHYGAWVSADVKVASVMNVTDATKLDLETLRKNTHSRNVVTAGLDGYYREESGVVEYRYSENWTCFKIPVSGLLYVKTLAGSDTSVLPALIFLDSAGNYLSRVQGDVLYVSGVYYFEEIVKPPSGATTCLINHYNGGGYGVMTNLEIQVVDKNYIGSITKRVFTQSNSKYVYYGENGVELKSSASWNYQIVPVENLRKIITYSSGSSQFALPISFFKGTAEEASINNTNFISGFQNSNSSGSRCEIDVVVPPEATFAVVNSVLSNDDGTFGAYYDVIDNGITSRYVVAKDGSGNFTSVAEAVDSVPDGSTIIVMPGVYEGCVRAWKKYVNIIGVNKEQCVLISYDGRYDNPAVEMSCGMLCNLTIASKYDAEKTVWQEGDSKAYALHIENQSNVTLVEGKEMVVKNCILYSDFNPAIGCGTFVDWTLRVEDCELTNNQGTDGISPSQYSEYGSLGALYIHDQNGANLGVGKVVIKNNIFRCKNYAAALCMYDRNLVGRGLDFTLVGNVLVGTSGQTDTIWWRSTTTPFGGDFVKNSASFGNSNTQLNN